MGQATIKLQAIYKHDVGVAFSSEVVSFRREFRSELNSRNIFIAVFNLLVDTHKTTSVPTLTTMGALLITLSISDQS